MLTFFYSGVNRPDILELLAEHHVAGMVNARCACEPRLVEAYTQFSDVKLALDCDARQRYLRQQRTGRERSPTYQLEEALDHYAGVIASMGQRFVWASCYDRIGDQQFTSWCYDRLVERLADPTLSSKLRWIYQQGDLAELEERARSLKHIGIGGMVPLLQQCGVTSFLRALAPIAEVLTRVEAQAHIYGLSDAYALSLLSAEPWFASADSAAWLIAYRAGALLQVNGERINATQLGLRLSRREIASNNLRVIQEWIDPARPHQFSWLKHGPEHEKTSANPISS
jgi:hypothetical protein